MTILDHHIYEFRKGVRDLMLMTVPKNQEEDTRRRLERSGIPYRVQKVGDVKANIYFGSSQCLEVLDKFGAKKLNEFSEEEDFILGIMLGYSRQEQYQRYCARKAQIIGA